MKVLKLHERILSSCRGFLGETQLRAEKARLEAFLSAVPGEYCGWAVDGAVVFSQGFCDALNRDVLSKPSDVYDALSPEHAVIFEGSFNRLCEHGVPFTMNAQNRADTKTLKLSGTRGVDLNGTDFFHILWVEDITTLKTAEDAFSEEQQALQVELDHLQDSLDALPNPVWIRDENQRITWCNVAYAKLLDIPPSQIIAEQKEIISVGRKRKPSEKGLVFGPALAALAHETGRAQNARAHEVIGGKRHLIKTSEIPIRGRDVTVGIAEDLSAEEQVLDTVKNNERTNRILLENLRSAIGIYDGAQQLAFYNTAFSQLWDLDETWLNAKPKLGDVMEKLREMRRLPEQADFKVYKASWVNMFTNLIDPHDDMLYLPDGRALRMLVVPNKLGGLMMTFEDVTSRLELESSYNTLIAVQRETLDNLAEGVAVFGGDGRLKLYNPTFSTLWAFDPEGLEGEPHITRIIDRISDFFDETDWPDVRRKILNSGLDRTPQAGRITRLDHKRIAYAAVPLPDGGVLVTYTDVTDTSRVEDALREKNAALETAESLKVDFLANVSYQLRTPLSAIMGFNELLDQEYFGTLNAKQKEYTHDIHLASERLLHLINDILDLSTIEAGKMDIDVESVSVYRMMKSIFGMVQEWARQKEIEVTLKCSKSIGNADLDASRIKQAVVNLVRNAIAHTPAGGHISLYATKKDEHIIISVTDDGVGIAEADQRRIIEPFERVDLHGAERGAGLGLSLVRHLVRLHHGTFDLSSREGEGTTVFLTLPKTQPSTGIEP